MNYIDLRSDTVTLPTDEMRRAMFNAQVGDDVYQDDPTINKLEALAAKMVGKEAALFVPSGTMGNQVSIMTHLRERGAEIIVSDECHVVAHEVGAAAVLSQAFARTLHYENGIPQPEMIRNAIRGENIHFPKTGLICLENPLASGKVVPLSVMAEIRAIADEKNIPIHMDGARLFNAATALGVEASEITQYVDSVMFCLSKGLCAPVGSMVAGSAEFIERARKNRKLLGGGMRQAGFLAAAGIIALEKMTKRLGEDHDNAKYMAKKLSEMDGISIDVDSVEINMVFFKLDRPQALKDALPDLMLKEGIKINGEEDGMFRFVTQNGVKKADIDKALEVFASLIA
jgi:threonine aldolase